MEIFDRWIPDAFRNIYELGKKDEDAIDHTLHNIIKKGVFSPVSPDSLSVEEKRMIIPSFIFFEYISRASHTISKVKKWDLP